MSNDITYDYLTQEIGNPLERDRESVPVQPELIGEMSTPEVVLPPSSHSTRKRNFVPNTYIIQCRNMILAEIWADLGRYGLQILHTIYLGPNSSHNNYLAVFEKDFLKKANHVISTTSSSRFSGGRGGTLAAKKQATTPVAADDSSSPLAATVVVDESGKTTETTTTGGTEIVLKGNVSGSVFTLRPFFVSTEFDAKPRSGSSIVPHIIIMYPRNLLHSSTKCRKWLESAIQALVKADILQADSCRMITDVRDENHLRRIETNNAFIQFKETVPHSARNAVYAILRNSLWFFSLSTDSFDPVVIQATETPSRVMCQWKIARRTPPAENS